MQPHIKYHLFGRPVTEEEWERYNAEQRLREAEVENKRNMEREERVLEEHEAKNEETVPT